VQFYTILAVGSDIMDNIDSNVGSLIKRKRKEKGLTLEELGRRINVNKGTISRWERNEISNMGIDKAKLLCKELNLPPLIFIEGQNLSNVSFEEITPFEFKTEVTTLLYRTNGLSESEKEMLITNIEFICNSKK